jgi:hypothetical protein
VYVLDVSEEHITTSFKAVLCIETRVLNSDKTDADFPEYTVQVIGRKHEIKVHISFKILFDKQKRYNMDRKLQVFCYSCFIQRRLSC